MNSRLLSSIKTRSPLKVFIVFAIGIILPGGFLSYLGLRSFQYEGMLMQKQTEEHFSATADLMQKKADERLLSFVTALRSVAQNEALQRLNLPGLLPLVLSPSKLETLPIENLFVFDEQERMIAPWCSEAVAAESRNVPRRLDWGPLREEMDRLEHMEFVDKQVDQAIQGYTALESSNLAPDLQAALLKNIAGGYRKLHINRSAETTYLKLIQNFDQVQDISGYPMGILGQQLLIKMYDEDKASDRTLETRLNLYEGLILHRWAVTPVQRESLLAELRKSIGPGDRRARWDRLMILERQWEQAQAPAEAFAKKEWPMLLKRLRDRGWLDQGGVLRWEGAGADKRIVVTAPILAPQSERRRGLLVAILPGRAAWPLLDQSLTELAQPVGLKVLYQSAGTLWKPKLQRVVDRIDPPLHFELLDNNAQDHNQLFRRRRWIYGGMFGLSFIVIVVGLVVMWQAVKREMEVANLKADFVATVSHELRTPLAAISHIGERLSLGRYRSEEERKEFYDLLGKETHRLRGLIEDVLDFSKMLAGRKVYKQETLHAVTLLQEAIESFEGKAEALGFEVALNVPGEDLLIQGDKRALLQAILNLMDNAIKYSGESRKIDVRLKSDQGRCLIEIQDYGIGIPESEKERIFEKFYRVENALSHASESGVGLGLAMVKYIVEGHRGVIRVESKIGHGSVFTLDFPIVQGGPDGSNSSR